MRLHDNDDRKLLEMTKKVEENHNKYIRDLRRNQAKDIEIISQRIIKLEETINMEIDKEIFTESSIILKHKKFTN